MRIVHTSDWHAGRMFKGVDRLPELAAVLDHMASWIEKERVDLLLLSGDVFDCGAPVPEAERVVFGFLKRMGRSGVQSVVIAGNHDSPARLEAWGGLAELVGVRTVSHPRSASQGGLLTLESRAGERARIGAVPFAAPRRLVSALEMADDDTRSKQKYADGMKAIVEDVTRPFAADTVNLLMLHTHLDGARYSGSERSVHLGDDWAATPQALPAAAHYVALGHIHKPQRIESAPAPALYAGSPLQMDFGEAGEEKSFVFVDARPRQPARCERIPYEGGRPLARVRATLEEIEHEAPRLSQAGHLLVTVPLVAPDPDLNRRVRQLLPNALRVEPELPSAPPAVVAVPRPKGTPPREAYGDYVLRERGSPAEPSLLDCFEALHTAVDEG